LRDDYIDTAANIIVEKRGMLHIHELLKDSFMLRRTFERRFLQKVGFSPKYYARLRRISYLCNLITGKRKVNWPDVFREAEYYDQAHFIKDFEEFTGRTPQQY
jgi:methylphosphotriester-DNA--protein-cysteine methyltransferase